MNRISINPCRQPLNKTNPAALHDLPIHKSKQRKGMPLQKRHPFFFARFRPGRAAPANGKQARLQQSGRLQKASHQKPTHSP
ncbi:MAG: hypothetical protein ACTTJV_06945 [Ottowia sp.]